MPSSERPKLKITYDHLVTVNQLLHGLLIPWYVSGGWAIYLFLGHVTQEHEDVALVAGWSGWGMDWE